eukprot:TRINITY_DN1523_c0_g1_i1.p1 TRINITY_DN1523_c0_g1~~TRINITY_DN1523_c0_g1_i1.p1  ORF type:complete len:150 (+),score=30.79 TRINITY_DN1523_c0_g1_i1:311-760(+)
MLSTNSEIMANQRLLAIKKDPIELLRIETIRKKYPNWKCSECHCSIKETLDLVTGPKGPQTLCSRCGLRYSKLSKLRNASEMYSDGQTSFSNTKRQPSIENKTALTLANGEILEIFNEGLKDSLFSSSDSSPLLFSHKGFDLSFILPLE